MRAMIRTVLVGFVLGLSGRAVMAGPPPRPDHIVIVIEENKGDEEIFGSIGAPYINSLANEGARFTNMYALTHPSQPNYLHLFSGAHQGVFDNVNPAAGTPFSTPNLGAALLGAGMTFSTYAEDLPGLGSLSADVGQYARRHNPSVNWQEDPPGTNQLSPGLNRPFFTDELTPRPFFGDVDAPTDYSGLPTVSIVVPNLINDMHDGSQKEADTWLDLHIHPYATWAMTHNSMLILTWDEDSGTTRNRIPTIIYGPMVRPGQYTAWWTLHDLLRMVEDLCGVAHSGAAAKARPIAGWELGTPVLTTRMFRQGLDGYAGAHDTYVEEPSPNTPRGLAGLNVVDTFPRSQALIRFDDFVGGAANQIPAGATIAAAKLAILTGRNNLLDDESGDAVSAHAMLTAWDEMSTWNSLDKGVSTDDVEAKAVADFTVVPNVLDAWAIFDVTDSVQAIVNGAAPNWGWLLQASGTDTWRAFSSDISNSEDRPRLVITYDTATCQATIGAQPAPVHAVVGGFASLSVGAGGADPISYQWRRDGTQLAEGGNLSGTTTSTLSITPVAATDGGTYDVLVNNPCGTVVSSGATMLVCDWSPSGDINFDGIVDGADVAAFSRAVIEGAMDPATVCAGDYSFNSMIDPSDVDRFVGVLLSVEQ